MRQPRACATISWLAIPHIRQNLCALAGVTSRVDPNLWLVHQTADEHIQVAISVQVAQAGLKRTADAKSLGTLFQRKRSGLPRLGLSPRGPIIAAAMVG